MFFHTVRVGGKFPSAVTTSYAFELKGRIFILRFILCPNIIALSSHFAAQCFLCQDDIFRRGLPNQESNGTTFHATVFYKYILNSNTTPIYFPNKHINKKELHPRLHPHQTYSSTLFGLEYYSFLSPCPFPSFLSQPS